jgi:ATP-dependent protease ClpP protease subunit
MKELKIVAKGDVTEVLLYEPIGRDFFGDGIDSKTFREQIKAIKTPVLNLRINSPGGSTTEAAAMMSVLDQHKAEVVVDIDGLAASAASVVAMAGSTIRIAGNALMMIHEPWAMSLGGAADHRQMADLLDKVNGTIIDAYMRKATVPRGRIEEMMAAETWLMGQEAVDVGLADKVTGQVSVAACAGMERFRYKHLPKLPEPAKVDLSNYRARIAALAKG